MKKIFNILYIAYILGIFAIILFLSNKELMGRLIIIFSYLFVVILCYYLYKYKAIDFVSKLSYYSDFDGSEKANQYLKYVYKSAIIFFVSGLILTCILHLLKISILVDIVIFLVLLFSWAISTYKFSKKIILMNK